MTFRKDSSEHKSEPFPVSFNVLAGKDILKNSCISKDPNSLQLLSENKAAILFSPRETTNNLKIFDLEKKSVVSELILENEYITSFIKLDANHILAATAVKESAFYDVSPPMPSLIKWNILTDEIERLIDLVPYQRDHRKIWSMCKLPSGLVLCAVEYCFEFLLFNPYTKEISKIKLAKSLPAPVIRLSLDKNYLIIRHTNMIICRDLISIFNLATQKIDLTFGLGIEYGVEREITPLLDHRLVVAANDKLKIFDTQTGKECEELGQGKYIRTVLMPDGVTLAALHDKGGYDKERAIQLIDINSGKIIQEIPIKKATYFSAFCLNPYNLHLLGYDEQIGDDGALFDIDIHFQEYMKQIEIALHDKIGKPAVIALGYFATIEQAKTKPTADTNFDSEEPKSAPGDSKNAYYTQ